jgi:dCMP deaminase
MKQKWIDAYMDVAERFAQLSSARKLQVGAIIVNDSRIISIGYNGTPTGWDNSCEEETWVAGDGTWDNPGTSVLTTKKEVIHAERNALDKLARTSGGAAGSIMFTTHMPCIECSKSIMCAGITQVYYRHKYKNDDGIRFLQKCGIAVTQIM